MPLTLAKCTNCGATLEVENTKDACICPYCKSAFIVEKAINNYNITNNISAGTVNIFGGNSADFVIRAGTLEKYNGASTVVVIPNSVTSIGKEAFQGCSGLKEITIPNSVTSIGERAFQGCSGLTEIIIPNSVTFIGVEAFQGCSGLTEITITNSVTSIYRAFTSCRGLTEVTIPNSVTSIQSAFIGCSGLIEVTIPNSVTSIDGAFKGCIGLTEVTIPNSVTSIGGTFKGCSGLIEVTIPNSVTSIGESAFEGCSRLREITIPKSVTSIGIGAFSGCEHLRVLTIENSQTTIITGNHYERPSFEFCNIETINAPEEWKKKYRNVFDCLKGSAPKTTNTYQTSGCYIATAVYGSYDAPEVMVLRRFRDEELQRTILGRAFIRTYCLLSPPVAKRLKNAKKINAAVRRILDKWVIKLEKRYSKTT